MAEIVKETVVDRSISEVYSFFFEPANFILMPGITEARRDGNTYWVKGQEKIPILGLESVSYKILIDEEKKPVQISFHTEDYITAMRGSWQLKELDDKTQVRFSLNYKAPFSFLGKIIDRFAMEKHIEEEVDYYLRNIQKTLEKVEAIMTRDVVTIEYPATVSNVMEKMDENNVHYLVVVEKGQLVGVISDGDVISKLYTKGFSPDAYIEQIMTKNVIKIGPEESIAEAINLMTTHKIRRLPVIKETEIVGIISISDLDSYLGVLRNRKRRL